MERRAAEHAIAEHAPGRAACPERGESRPASANPFLEVIGTQPTSTRRPAADDARCGTGGAGPLPAVGRQERRATTEAGKSRGHSVPPFSSLLNPAALICDLSNPLLSVLPLWMGMDSPPRRVAAHGRAVAAHGRAEAGGMDEPVGGIEGFKGGPVVLPIDLRPLPHAALPLRLRGVMQAPGRCNRVRDHRVPHPLADRSAARQQCSVASALWSAVAGRAA
jgi:hypothetical protein